MAEILINLFVASYTILLIIIAYFLYNLYRLKAEHRAEQKQFALAALKGGHDDDTDDDDDDGEHHTKVSESSSSSLSSALHLPTLKRNGLPSHNGYNNYVSETKNFVLSSFVLASVDGTACKHHETEDSRRLYIELYKNTLVCNQIEKKSIEFNGTCGKVILSTIGNIIFIELGTVTLDDILCPPNLTTVVAIVFLPASQLVHKRSTLKEINNLLSTEYFDEQVQFTHHKSIPNLCTITRKQCVINENVFKQCSCHNIEFNNLDAFNFALSSTPSSSAGESNQPNASFNGFSEHNNLPLLRNRAVSKKQTVKNTLDAGGLDTTGADESAEYNDRGNNGIKAVESIKKQSHYEPQETENSRPDNFGNNNVAAPPKRLFSFLTNIGAKHAATAPVADDNTALNHVRQNREKTCVITDSTNNHYQQLR